MGKKEKAPLIVPFIEKAYRDGERIVREGDLTAADLLHGITSALTERMMLSALKKYPKDQIAGEFEQLSKIIRQTRAYADQAAAWRKEKANAPSAVL